MSFLLRVREVITDHATETVLVGHARCFFRDLTKILVGIYLKHGI